MNTLKINFLARAKNKLFWMALIPALFLLVQMVAAIFGFNFVLSELQGRVVAAVDALFAVLVILGVVVDPTTEGFGDSAQAMTYTAPKKSTHESEKGDVARGSGVRVRGAHGSCCLLRAHGCLRK